jgi:hypothetical protein
VGTTATSISHVTTLPHREHREVCNSGNAQSAAAKALGITVPLIMQMTAREVIEVVAVARGRCWARGLRRGDYKHTAQIASKFELSESYGGVSCGWPISPAFRQIVSSRGAGRHTQRGVKVLFG